MERSASLPSDVASVIVNAKSVRRVSECSASDQIDAAMIFRGSGEDKESDETSVWE